MRKFHFALTLCLLSLISAELSQNSVDSYSSTTHVLYKSVTANENPSYDDCAIIPGSAPYLKLVMGSVVDYFRPIAGKTYCDMLKSHQFHEWSDDGESWVNPSHYNHHLGGSARHYPSDGRNYLSFWGGHGNRGGCCRNSYTGPDGWHQTFSLYYPEQEHRYDCESFLIPSTITAISDAGSLIGEHWSQFDCKYQCSIQENCVAFLSEQRVENGETYCWMFSEAGDDLVAVTDIQSGYVDWNFCYKRPGSTIIRDESSDNLKCGMPGDNSRVFHLSQGAATLENCRNACIQDPSCVAFSAYFYLSRLVFCIGCDVPLDTPSNGAVAYKRIGESSTVINYGECTTINSETGPSHMSDPGNWNTKCPENTAVVSVETASVETQSWTIVKMRCCALVDKITAPGSHYRLPRTAYIGSRPNYLQGGGSSSVEDQWEAQCEPNAIMVGIYDDDDSGEFDDIDAAKCNTLECPYTCGEKIDSHDCVVIDLSPASLSSCPIDYVMVGLWDNTETKFNCVRKMKCCRVLESILPTVSPTQMPTTDEPSGCPTVSPTTSIPSQNPTTEEPSASPTTFPTYAPTLCEPTCRSHTDQLVNVLGRLLDFNTQLLRDFEPSHPLNNVLNEMILDVERLKDEMNIVHDDMSIFPSEH